MNNTDAALKHLDSALSRLALMKPSPETRYFEADLKNARDAIVQAQRKRKKKAEVAP